MAPPEIGRPTKAAVLLLLASLATGCAARSARGGGLVSGELRTLAGFALRAAPGSGAALPEGVSLSDGLSEDEAVAIALWRSAGLELALAELGLVKADLVETGLIRNPVFSILLPPGPKQLEFRRAWPVEALRQRRRRSADGPSDLARTTLRLLGGLDLVRDVRLAYADALLEEERARLAEDSRDVRVSIAAIAATQLRAGEISQLEAAFFRVDATRARDEAVRAARAAKSSSEALLALVGLAGEAPSPLVLAPAAATRPRLPEPDALLKEALAARPELRAAELAMEAAAGRAGIPHSEVLALVARLDASGAAQAGPQKGPQPLGRREKRLARARAGLELEARRYVETRERIALEVRQARAALLRSREAVDVWEGSALPELERNLARVEKARDAGDASPLEALSARRSLVAARLLGAEARAAERKAEATLGRGVGCSL